ncbi:MAG TPA: GNAT family N-acetyltransferase [Longimicrobium sp.]|jgi:RimJ/RimL family protein N-acetyltransferase
MRPDFPVLETERLRLRPLSRADTEHLAELDADPEVGRYVHFGGSPTRADLEAALPRMLACFGFPPVQPAFWAAEERGSGRFVGWFHLRPSGEADTLELGYRFRRDTWGKGYASEGARALVVRAFEDLGAKCVEAIALVENAGSIRVMEKAGLRLRERFLYEGERPTVRYAVERSEYEGGAESVVP